MSSPSTTNGHPAAGVSHEEKKRPAPDIDLDAPEYYLNRELTWLTFVKRVLHEAEDKRTPLLERVKFLAITSSILDEFFMKRIGGLKQQVAAGVHKLTVDGRSPMRQIEESHELIRPLNVEQQGLWVELRQKLEKIGVRLASYESLPEKDQQWLRDDYLDNIFPLVTPQAMDPAHPFPFVSNLSLNLLVSLHYPSDPAPLMARVKVPLGAGVPRFIQVRDSLVFVPTEEIMANNLDLLFPGMVIERTELFRVTRNADVRPPRGGSRDGHDSPRPAGSGARPRRAGRRLRDRRLLGAWRLVPVGGARHPGASGSRPSAGGRAKPGGTKQRFPCDPGQ
jgi:polyphosphate kinase